jgi:hypothetical protein
LEPDPFADMATYARERFIGATAASGPVGQAPSFITIRKTNDDDSDAQVLPATLTISSSRSVRL